MKLQWWSSGKKGQKIHCWISLLCTCVYNKDIKKWHYLLAFVHWIHPPSSSDADAAPLIMLRIIALNECSQCLRREGQPLLQGHHWLIISTISLVRSEPSSACITIFASNFGQKSDWGCGKVFLRFYSRVERYTTVKHRKLNIGRKASDPELHPIVL